MEQRLDIFACDNTCRALHKNITQAGLWMHETYEGIEYEPLVYLNTYHAPTLPSTSVSTGATYKQLAYIGHLIGMDTEERSRWYEVARQVPLSRSHAGHIIEEIEDIQHVVEQIERELLSVT